MKVYENNNENGLVDGLRSYLVASVGLWQLMVSFQGLEALAFTRPRSEIRIHDKRWQIIELVGSGKENWLTELKF